jgi:ribonuclease E
VAADAQSLTEANGQTVAPRNENGEVREKRPRDRYGRDRGPRGERSEREDRPDLRIPASQAAAPSSGTDETAPPVSESAAPAAEVVAATVPATPAVQPVRSAAPIAAPVVAATPAELMPKVTAYALPTETLIEVAQSSGLQWVNSDADKIAAVQAAIAAEAKPIHVPRERPAPVSIDTGPLVLVETKRDLRNMVLPFEQPPSA